MTWPLEGSREIDEGIIISEAMDWCKSPTAIVPYRLYAYQRDAMNLAYTVRQTSNPTHVKDSIVLKSYGDEPGIGGGVISGTHNAECTPKTWSQCVTAQGRNVVRHTDEWWMNHKNTYGILLYQKNMNQFSIPQTDPITPSMSPQNARAFEANYTSGGTQLAQALPEPLVPEEPVLPPGEMPGGPEELPPSGPEEVPPGGPEEAPPENPSHDNDNEPQLGPKGPPKEGEGSDPEPRLKPKPKPLPQPRGFRVSGCLGITICFDPTNKDKGEYQKQLSEQQGVLNGKTAAGAVSDINKYDANPAGMRSEADAAADRYNANNTAPTNFPGGAAATHRLDIQVGGNPNDISRFGDSGVNSSIGQSWRGYRKEFLKSYAEEMMKRGCPMSVHLDLCGKNVFIYPILMA